MASTYHPNASWFSLEHFANTLAQDEDAVDLLDAATLVEAIAYPEPAYDAIRAELDRLASVVQGHLDSLNPKATMAARAKMLLSVLYKMEGFRGNRDDYYDPHNSFMRDVLERKTGIPISLGMLIVMVAQRCHLPLRGVAFPSHFLVRCDDVNQVTMIDPFEGLILTDNAMAALHERATNTQGAPPPELLEPATPRIVVRRMLANLHSIYLVRKEPEPLFAVLQRINLLNAIDRSMSDEPSAQAIIN